ncbi:hypothetical protein [Actinomadura parmotrematis]|uniref:Lipoprotein n=1 Tax=Actinomadura parmotrematis TaxID=2864039 RepID=A0ABS7FWS9_9ACTN|nr:hypothetical protein [Actinomadura parmotrematis]MBW8483908.1 hypothetical protein [Actinomadura parmotrematis]
MSIIGRGLLGGTLVAALLTGCARGPVLSESVYRLRTDATLMLTGGASQLGEPGVRLPPVTETVSRCPNGEARRSLRGEVPLRPAGSPALLVVQATDVTLDIMNGRGYRLAAPPEGQARRRDFTLTRDSPALTFVVRLRSGGRHPMLTLDGSTPCLPVDG